MGDKPKNRRWTNRGKGFILVRLEGAFVFRAPASEKKRLKKMSQESEETKGQETPPKKGGLPLMRATGVLLLVAAAFLYYHDLREGMRRAKAADAVRYVAEMSVLGLGIRATPQPGAAEQPIYEPCSPQIASNILARLALADEVKAPALDEMARSYDLFLFLTNRTRVFLSARRRPGADEAFVSLREPRHNTGFGSNGGHVSFVEFPPSRVTGLGAIFDEIDSGSLDALRSARVMPAHVLKAWTNLVRRAGVAGLDEKSLGSTAASLAAIIASERPVGGGVSKGLVAASDRPALRPIPKPAIDRIADALGCRRC